MSFAAAHSAASANSLQALQQRVKQLLSPAAEAVVSTVGSESSSSLVSPSVASCTPAGHPLRWWLRGPGYRRSGSDSLIDGGHNLLKPGWQWVNEHGIVLTHDIATSAPQQLRTIDSCVDWSVAEATAARRALPELVRALHAHAKSQTAGNGFAAIQPYSASWDHLKALLHEESQSASSASPSSSSVRMGVGEGALAEEFPPTASELLGAVQGWSESQLQYFLQAHERLAAVTKAFADEDVASILPLEWADAAGRPAMGQAPMPICQWYANQTPKQGADPKGKQPERADEATTAGEQVNRSLRGATNPIFFLLPWCSSYDRRPSTGSGQHTPARAVQPTSAAEEMAWAEMDEAQRDATLQACIEPAVLVEHGNNLMKSAPFFTMAAESDSTSSSESVPIALPLEAEARLDQPSAWMAQLSSVVRGCPWPLISTSSTMSPYASRIWSETVCAANHIAAQLRLLDFEPAADAIESKQGVTQADALAVQHSLVPPDTSIACVDLHLFWTACATSSSPVESADSDTRRQMEAVRLAQEREVEARGSQKPATDMNVAWSHRFASRQYLLARSSSISSDSAAAANSGAHALPSHSHSHTPLSDETTRVLREAFPFPIEIHLGRHYSPAPVVIASPIAPGWVACILVGSDATLTQRF